MQRVHASAHGRSLERDVPVALRRCDAGFPRLKAGPDRRCETGALALRTNLPVTTVEHPKTPICGGGVWKTSRRWFPYSRSFRQGLSWRRPRLPHRLVRWRAGMSENGCLATYKVYRQGDWAVSAAAAASQRAAISASSSRRALMRRKFHFEALDLATQQLFGPRQVIALPRRLTMQMLLEKTREAGS